MDIRQWVTETLHNIAVNKHKYKLTERQLEALDYFEEDPCNEIELTDSIINQLELEDVMLQYLEHIKL